MFIVTTVKAKSGVIVSSELGRICIPFDDFHIITGCSVHNAGDPWDILDASGILLYHV